MRRWMLSTLTVGAVALLAAPAPAQMAKEQPGLSLEVEVPFEFVVNGKTFPSGVYEVDSVPEEENAPVLTIQRAKPAENGDLRFVNVMTRPVRRAETGERPSLVFERVGDENFLEEVVPHTGMVREVTQ